MDAQLWNFFSSIMGTKNVGFLSKAIISKVVLSSEFYVLYTKRKPIQRANTHFGCS